MNTELQVALSIEEREFVKQAADSRNDANKRTWDIADYDPKRFNLTGLQANRLGVFAEAVAFKWLGGNVLDHTLEEWAHFVPNSHPDYDSLVKGQADLNINGLSVEVRRANGHDSPIPIRTKDRKEGLRVLQVFVPYMQAKRGGPIIVKLHARLLGWAHNTDEGTTPPWAGNRGSIVVPRRSMSEWPVGVSA